MIKIYHDKLPMQLQQKLYPCYLVFGDEPFFVQESQKMIQQHAKTQGFTEDQRFVIEPQMNWSSLFNQCQCLSLFAQKKIILLQFPTTAVNQTLGNKLIELSTFTNPDLLFIFSGTKLTKEQEASRWFTSFASYAVYVRCLTPNHRHLQKWVTQQAQKLALQLDQATIQLLCDYYEGNLLALAQSLEKLLLLVPEGKISFLQVKKLLHQATHFSVYHWIDALFMKNDKRVHHILREMQQEEKDPILLIRALQRDLLLLLMISKKMHEMPLKQCFDLHNVWQSRRELLTQTLRSCSVQQFEQAIILLAQAERLAKKEFMIDAVWDKLALISTVLSHQIDMDRILND